MVLFFHSDYRTGYALLLISSLLALGSLVVARINFPVPARLEEGRTAPASELGRSYWLYMTAATCFAAGLMSYELIAYHLATAKIVAENWIPLLLAFSTGCGVIASLVLGKLYDRARLPTLLAAVFLSSLFTPGPFEALKEFSCRDPLAGNHRCCCVRVSQSPVLAGVLAGGVPCPLSGGGMPLQEVAARESDA